MYVLTHASCAHLRCLLLQLPGALCWITVLKLPWVSKVFASSYDWEIERKMLVHCAEALSRVYNMNGRLSNYLCLGVHIFFPFTVWKVFADYAGDAQNSGLANYCSREIGFLWRWFGSRFLNFLILGSITFFSGSQSCNRRMIFVRVFAYQLNSRTYFLST